MKDMTSNKQQDKQEEILPNGIAAKWLIPQTNKEIIHPKEKWEDMNKQFSKYRYSINTEKVPSALETKDL